jgi:hypothetical protein
MRTLLALLLAAHAGAALAQYKCTSAAGAITFQQTPCFGAKAEEKLNVVPNGHPPGASGVKPAPAPAAASTGADSVDKRMLANYNKQREREAVAKEVDAAREDKARLGTQRQEAIAAARRQSGDDPANANSLRDVLDSINKRYDALEELADSRQRAAQQALDQWDRSQPKGK